KNEAQKAWRRESTPSTKKARPGLSRRSKLAMVGLLILAVVGGTIWWIFRIKPIKPVYVVLINAGYEDNLAIPANVHGVNGVEGFKKVAKANENQFNVADSQSPDNWKTALDKFRNEGKEKTIVLYLALQGGGDIDGPYLLVDKTAPGKGPKA